MNIEDIRELVQQFDSLERKNKNLSDLLWNQEVRYEKRILELSKEMSSLLCKYKIAIDNLQLIADTCMRVEIRQLHEGQDRDAATIVEAEKERDEARADLRRVGDAMGYVNYGEGTGGYEIAPTEKLVEEVHRLSREHPYEECRKREAFEAFLLKLVETKGGCVVSSNDCSEWEIVAARACDRFYVDSRAYGYVIRPSQKRTRNHL